MIISTNTDNLFNKIKHTSMIKALSKLEIEGDFLNLVNRSYETPTTDIVLNGEGLNAFCLRSIPAFAQWLPHCSTCSPRLRPERVRESPGPSGP